MFHFIRISIIASLIAMTGCATTYYGTLEKFGVEKRDILVDRVKDARGEQAEAQETFASALEEFRALVNVDGGALEQQYDKLNTSYVRSQKQAAEVRERITAVNDVGDRLFKEWEKELNLYESPELRRRSSQQMAATQDDYKSLLAAMNRAADKMNPVLELYQDQVLFLKHNLNARAIYSLEIERAQIEEQVAALIEEMNASIAEADEFIASMS